MSNSFSGFGVLPKTFPSLPVGSLGIFIRQTEKPSTAKQELLPLAKALPAKAEPNKGERCSGFSALYQR
jgi:hypothetical protein